MYQILETFIADDKLPDLVKAKISEVIADADTKVL
jgi:hypothetical protein